MSRSRPIRTSFSSSARTCARSAGPWASPSRTWRTRRASAWLRFSRIETNKQGIDLGLFLSLAKILRCEPADLLQIEADQDEPGERLAGQIAVLNTAERLRLWRRLATDARVSRVRKRSAVIRQLAMQVEELLAQVDFVRAEIEAVNQRLRR